MKKNWLQMIDDHLEEIILFPGLSFLVVGLGVEVFRRYVLNVAGAYTSEIATFSFVWVVYFGVPYAVKQNKHITLDLLPENLAARTDTILRIVSLTIQIVFFTFMVIQTLRLIQFNRMVDMVSDAMSLPLWIALLCFPIGFGIGVLRLIQSMILLLRRKPE